MKRDEVAITGAKVSAANCAREWVKRLVNVGASDDEIAEVIQDMTRQANAEAKILADRRGTKVVS